MLTYGPSPSVGGCCVECCKNSRVPSNSSTIFGTALKILAEHRSSGTAFEVHASTHGAPVDEVAQALIANQRFAYRGLLACFFGGLNAATRDALREQFQLCNQARYAPVRGTSELNSVAAQFEQLVRALQELKA